MLHVEKAEEKAGDVGDVVVEEEEEPENSIEKE
jgi:hypothetical protein